MQEFGQRQEQYGCLVMKVIVTITMQKFRFLGGIGDSSFYEQVDYKCSIDGDCPRSMDLSCPVRKLNEG